MNSQIDREAATELTFQFKEHRRALRQAARRVPLALHKDSDDTPLADAALQDLSRTGMRVRSETSLPCGYRILIHAPVDSGLPPVIGRIMRVNLIDLSAGEVFEFGIHITEEQRETGNAWYLYFHYGAGKDTCAPTI